MKWKDRTTGDKVFTAVLSIVVLIVCLKMIPAQDPRDLMFFAMLSGAFIAGNYFKVGSDKEGKAFSKEMRKEELWQTMGRAEFMRRYGKMMRAAEVKAWMKEIPDDADIGVDDEGLTLVAISEAADERWGSNRRHPRRRRIMTNSLIEEAVKRDLRGFWIRMAGAGILLLLRVVLKFLHVKEAGTWWEYFLSFPFLILMWGVVKRSRRLMRHWYGFD